MRELFSEKRARRGDVVWEMRTDARRETISGTHAQLWDPAVLLNMDPAALKMRIRIYGPGYEFKKFTYLSPKIVSYLKLKKTIGYPKSGHQVLYQVLYPSGWISGIISLRCITTLNLTWLGPKSDSKLLERLFLHFYLKPRTPLPVHIIKSF